MKHYTLELYQDWPDDEVADEELSRHMRRWQESQRSYDEYLATTLSVLRPDLLPMAEAFYIDDALIVSAEHDCSTRRLNLVLRCGNLVVNYFDLVLGYEGVEIEEEHWQVLTNIADRVDTTPSWDADGVCHELEILEDGRLEHRFLFHPLVWFAIRCEDLKWERREMPDRELPQVEPRYSRVG